MTKMTLRQCEELAKNSGHDKATFDLCGPSGCVKATWLDAYFGLFMVEGETGFNTVKQAEEHGLWAENFCDSASNDTSALGDTGGEDA
jgi:hypothetical protein